MSVTYARVFDKSAPLYSEFSRPFLERHFTPAVVAALYDALPTYSRGPRKGKLKGYVEWSKCESGGWHRLADGRGYVMRPGTHDVRVIMDGRCLMDENANATDENRIAYFQSVIARKA